MLEQPPKLRNSIFLRSTLVHPLHYLLKNKAKTEKKSSSTLLFLFNLLELYTKLSFAEEEIEMD